MCNELKCADNDIGFFFSFIEVRIYLASERKHTLVSAMAKQISQNTFDDVVRENISEFEMEVSEAVQDAIQQFESQVC